MERITVIKTWLGTGSINLFGRPFAGKDSQAQLLADLFDGVVVGSGDIIRNSTIPDDVRAIMQAGGIVPSNTFVEVVLPYLKQDSLAGSPLILSSVGRWYGEHIGVMDALESSDHPQKAVIYLNVAESDVMERWRNHEQRKDREVRHDDSSEDVLQIRFEEFRTKTLPVIEYYREKGVLIEINGNQQREVVHHQIIDALYLLATQQD